MKNLTKFTVISALALAGSASAQTNLEVGALGGWSEGLNAEVFVQAPRLSGNIGAKGSVAFGAFDNSKDKDAAGNQTVLGLDAIYSLGELAPNIDVDAYAGARFGMFNQELGSLKYSKNTFGIGAGVQAAYAISPDISIVGDLGMNQFFGGNSTISKDGTPLNEPNYKQFDEPDTIFKAKVGAKIKL